VTIEEFKLSVTQGRLPADLSPALAALWQDARGDWAAAHHLAQDIQDKTGAWIHAYLHRKEGDANNAAYWYRRAGRPIAGDSLEDEWHRIASELLPRCTGSS
jgi:hypothetical protein